MWVRSGFWLSPQLAGALALRLLPPGSSQQPDPIADAAPAAAQPRPAAPAAAPGGLRESAGAERAGAAEAHGGEGAGRGRGAPAEARGAARHAPEGGPSTSGGAGDAGDIVLGLRLLQGRVRSSPSPSLGPHSLGVLQASSEAAHRPVFQKQRTRNPALIDSRIAPAERMEGCLMRQHGPGRCCHALETGAPQRRTCNFGGTWACW
jgi:hypothetical protein